MFTISKKAVLLLVFSLLAACTQESKVKKAAIESVRQTYLQKIEFEAENRIYKESVFKESYRSVLSEKIILEVVSVQVDDSEAQVQVRQQSPPFEVRRVLIEILNRNREKNSASFNVPDALRLIHKQMQVPLSGKEELYRVELSLINGEWQVTKKSLLR